MAAKGELISPSAVAESLQDETFWMKMSKERVMCDFDYICIGAGSGGIASANRAALRGAKVALIEGNRVGGTCVNVGCVPKKAMWFGAQVAEAIKLYASDYGFDVTLNQFDWKTLIESREAYIQRIHASYDRVLAKNNITRIEGYGHFVNNNTVAVNGIEYRAKHILIATGGRPIFPDIPGAELGVDSDGFFAWQAQPQRVAVVGAGYIAVEIAGVLHSLGTTTHLVVRKERPLRQFDDMLGNTLVELMQQDGPTLHTHCTPQKVLKNTDGSLLLCFENGQSLEVDQIIWAIGRAPRTADLQLQNTDVELNAKGYIKTENSRTRPQRIFTRWAISMAKSN